MLIPIHKKGMARKPQSESSVVISGPDIFIPAGNYKDDVNKSIEIVEQAVPSVEIDSNGLITAEASQIEGYVEEGIKSNTKQLTTQAAKTITPTTSEQTAVASGVYTTGAVKVAAMPTVTQATPSISVSSAGLITASATQSAGYVNAGTKSATSQLNTQAAQTITPGTSDKTIASGRYLTGTQTIKGDANLIAGNIKKGVSIFGVAGTAVTNELPTFTYDGTYSVINDGSGNWRIKFLTSGTFIPNNTTYVDVFLVGGGGGGASTDASGGGGGGYTKTATGIALNAGQPYSIVVGAGGASASSGGTSTAFNVSASGGSAPTVYRYGGNGGSGGGGWPQGVASTGQGGSNGSNGAAGYNGGGSGVGQGTTTREFGESSGDLYAGGGGGGTGYAGQGSPGGAGGGGNGYYYNYVGQATAGQANTGGGGGGGFVTYDNKFYGGAGGSGIVIIRNTR